MPDASHPFAWIGRSKKAFHGLPDEVQNAFSVGLDAAREGEREIPGAKPLTKGILKGLGIWELVKEFDRDTYRAVFTVMLPEVLAVLHVFKKKSQSGIGTSLHDIRLVRARHREAVRLHSKAAHRDRR